MSEVTRIFERIRKGVERHPEVVQSTKAVVKYNISGKDGSEVWFLDLKNGKGAVTTSSQEKVDCEISMSAEDFIGFAEGTVDPMEAFMGGKLKIKGNLMIAQKMQDLFEQLDEEEGSEEFKADAVFSQMKERLSNDPSLVRRVNGVFAFTITKEGGSKTFLVDLKNDSGSITEGDGKADCSIELSDDDFVQLMRGELHPQTAFMEGKLKLKGNIMMTQKLEFLMSTKSAL